MNQGHFQSSLLSSIVANLTNYVMTNATTNVETTVMPTPLATSRPFKKLGDFLVTNKVTYNIEAEYLYTSLIDVIPIIAGIILLIIVGLEIVCVVDTCIRIEACIINEENQFYNNVNAAVSSARTTHETERAQSNVHSAGEVNEAMANSTTVIIRNEMETNERVEFSIPTR